MKGWCPKVSAGQDTKYNLAEARVNLRLYDKCTKEMYPGTPRAIFIKILVCLQLYTGIQWGLQK